MSASLCNPASLLASLPLSKLITVYTPCLLSGRVWQLQWKGLEFVLVCVDQFVVGKRLEYWYRVNADQLYALVHETGFNVAAEQIYEVTDANRAELRIFEGADVKTTAGTVRSLVFDFANVARIVVNAALLGVIEQWNTAAAEQTQKPLSTAQ